MAAVRNAPVACRFDPEVKQALSIIAECDGRSMANMMEWLIRKHCEKEGLGCCLWHEPRVSPRSAPTDGPMPLSGAAITNTHWLREPASRTRSVSAFE